MKKQKIKSLQLNKKSSWKYSVVDSIKHTIISSSLFLTISREESSTKSYTYREQEQASQQEIHLDNIFSPTKKKFYICQI